MNLYITADRVADVSHGGSQVTFQESQALRSLGPCEVWDREELESVDRVGLVEPWNWGLRAQLRLSKIDTPRLAHFYAGTFSNVVGCLQREGCKVTYTAAAHSIEESKKEHESLGFRYDYPHLTDSKLWERYVRGYLEADKLIVPSTHSREVMLSFGAQPDRVVLIPHGTELPTTVAPLPEEFVVGYLGAYGPDKGVIYLLQAWEKLRLKDARLVLGGRDSTSPFVRALIQHFCPHGRVECLGWVDNISDFYNQISLYVQPSVTEGFGIEVLEALAHDRGVLCSDGAGASDAVPQFYRFSARDVDQLCDKIRFYDTYLRSNGYKWSTMVQDYTWDKIREKYISVWKELLSGTNTKTE